MTQFHLNLLGTVEVWNFRQSDSVFYIPFTVKKCKFRKTCPIFYSFLSFQQVDEDIYHVR